MSEQLELLDITTTPLENLYFDQISNSKGMIWMLNSMQGLVYVYDPLGEKQLMKLKDITRK